MLSKITAYSSLQWLTVAYSGFQWLLSIPLHSLMSMDALPTLPRLLQWTQMKNYKLWMLLLIFSWHGNLPKNSENETFLLFLQVSGIYKCVPCSLLYKAYLPQVRMILFPSMCILIHGKQCLVYKKCVKRHGRKAGRRRALVVTPQRNLEGFWLPQMSLYQHPITP